MPYILTITYIIYTHWQFYYSVWNIHKPLEAVLFIIKKHMTFPWLALPLAICIDNMHHMFTFLTSPVMWFVFPICHMTFCQVPAVYIFKYVGPCSATRRVQSNQNLRKFGRATPVIFFISIFATTDVQTLLSIQTDCIHMIWQITNLL
jgi:hypothetical protein